MRQQLQLPAPPMPLQERQQAFLAPTLASATQTAASIWLKSTATATHCRMVIRFIRILAACAMIQQPI